MRNRSDIDPFDYLDWEEKEYPKEKKSTPQQRRTQPVGDDWYNYSGSGSTSRNSRNKRTQNRSSVTGWILLLLVAAATYFMFLRPSWENNKNREPSIRTEPTSFQFSTEPSTAPTELTTTPTEPASEPVPQWEVRYFGKQLTASQQQLYVRVVDCLMNVEPELKDIQVSKLDDLKDTVEAVYRDYAELFWYPGGYSTSYYDRNGYFDVTYIPNYRWNKQEALQRKAYVENASQEILSQLQGKSDYEKVKGVFNYLVDQTAYDYAYMNTTIYELFHDQRAVCEGYARTTQYLLNQLGVETLYISGEAGSNGDIEAHAWNVVLVDGAYYQLDVTWGDPYDPDGTQTKTYDYMCITEEEIRRDHTANWSEYPSCTSIDRNYFIMEDRYLQYYSLDTLVSWAQSAYYAGVPLTFKAANKAVYDQTMNSLFPSGDINTLLTRIAGSSIPCSYSGNDVMYSITIYWN